MVYRNPDFLESAKFLTANLEIVYYFHKYIACNISSRFDNPYYYYLLDFLWGQPIKLVQVASTSELRENQQNDLLFFEIVPCHFCGASEVQT